MKNQDVNIKKILSKDTLAKADKKFNKSLEQMDAKFKKLSSKRVKL